MTRTIMSNIYSLVQYTTYGEHTHGGQFLITVIFQDGIVMAHKIQIFHLELLILQRNIKEFVENPK